MNIVLIVSVLFSVALFFLIKSVSLSILLSIATLSGMVYYVYFAKNKIEGPIKYSKINAVLIIFLSGIYLLESKVSILTSSNLIYWLLTLSLSSVTYDLLRSKKYYRVIFNLLYWVSLWRIFSIVFFVNPNLEHKDIALSLIALFVLFVSISSTLRIIRDKNEERSEARE